jgi:undecaprenyl-diphosphatase
VPSLLGWRYAELPPADRKSFEVALHAASLPALVAVARATPRLEPLPALLALAPPALAGLAGERLVEERLGGARTVAVAQVVAGLLLFVADVRRGTRRRPGNADFVVAGLAQAAALVPGVSRAGAAITAARLRGLERRAAVELSFGTALPVTAAAAGLKAVRAAGRPTAVPLASLAAGVLAAGLSSAACVPLARRLPRGRPLAPVAAYRVGFGALVLARSPLRS